jgi:hypothetical protein
MTVEITDSSVTSLKDNILIMYPIINYVNILTQKTEVFYHEG